MAVMITIIVASLALQTDNNNDRDDADDDDEDPSRNDHHPFAALETRGRRIGASRNDLLSRRLRVLGVMLPLFA